MKTVLAFALAATAAATPAFADPIASAAAPAPVATSAPDAGQRYCLKIPSKTGSFIDRKVCRTRADWAKDGVDPLAMRK